MYLNRSNEARKTSYFELFRKKDELFRKRDELYRKRDDLYRKKDEKIAMRECVLSILVPRHTITEDVYV